jgi:hypothetical protein
VPVVSGVVNVEFFGGEEFFKNVAIFLEEMFDKSVGFSDESTFGAIVVPAETFSVLEDREHLLVAEEFAEETKISDGKVGNTRCFIESLDSFVDDIELIPLLEESDDLPRVVFPGIEPAFGRGFCQFFVRAAVGESIGNGVAGIAWSQHAATVFVGFAGAELVSINKLGLQNEGLDELLDSLEIA